MKFYLLAKNLLKCYLQNHLQKIYKKYYLQNHLQKTYLNIPNQ